MAASPQWQSVGCASNTSTLKASSLGSSRSSFEHTPLPAVNSMKDTKQIEEGLQRLREEFRSGKMRAFGSSTREAMDNVCRLQQDLAQQHVQFDKRLDHTQAGSFPESNHAILIGTRAYTEASQEGVSQLMVKLANLSSAVRRLRQEDDGIEAVRYGTDQHAAASVISDPNRHTTQPSQVGQAHLLRRPSSVTEV